MPISKSELVRIKQLSHDAINSCRGAVLDTFELECGENPNWSLIRGRLLRSFGDRGLTGRITEILDREIGSKGET